MKGSGLDKDLHQRALRRLKWMEKVYDLKNEQNVFDDIRHIINTMLQRLSGTPRSIGHIKAFIEFEGMSIKIGITAMNENDWKTLLENKNAKTAKMILNARIHSDDPIDDLFI